MPRLLFITQKVIVTAAPIEVTSVPTPRDIATTLGSAVYDPDSIDGG